MDNTQKMITNTRHLLQMTQRALAAEMGFSNQHLNGVERGKIAASRKFMQALWRVIDDHGVRDAISGDDVQQLTLLYKALPADVQKHIMGIMRALTKPMSDVEEPPAEENNI